MSLSICVAQKTNGVYGTVCCFLRDESSIEVRLKLSIEEFLENP